MSSPAPSPWSKEGYAEPNIVDGILIISPWEARFL
jgi:hypothetical protein